MLAGLACTPEAEEPNAFTTASGSFTASSTATVTATDTATSDETGTDSMTTSSSTEVPPDMPATTDPSTGDGDGEPPTTTTGDGDGEPDPTTGGGANCGNNEIENGEQCDGANLGGFTCVDLGYSGGTLSCDPITCTYDASGCVTDMEGGGSGGTTG